MKKNNILILIALAIIAIGAYFGIKKNSSTDSSMTSTESSSIKTLKDILGLGTSQKCTYQGGVVYVADGKIRGDFTPIDEEGQKDSHMIVANGTSYVWMEGETTGYKMTFDTNATPPPDTGEETTEQYSTATQPEDYVCEAWTPDTSLFNLPEAIEFTDINAMMPTTTDTTMMKDTSTSADTSSQCSYCETLSGDQKDQCLSALNCQ